MFQLLQPIWLWGMSGIIIPVVIHLWNIREGKTLKVGSISLLQESARQHARSLKLKDLLLLLLRCLIIIAFAFLLAKPVWKKQLFSSTEKGWVLIEKGRINEAYQQHRSKIDSLRNAGFKFHYLNDDFLAEEWDVALKQATDTNRKEDVSYWTLLKKLNEILPPDLPVYLFTTNELQRFSGPRPTVAMNLNWFVYSLPDSTIKKPFAIHRSSTDSLKVTISNSSSHATHFTTENVAGKNIDANTILDTAAINVAIYADQSTTDAMYLRAAIDAIKQTADIKINVTSLKNEEDVNGRWDWLFWLSEKPLPQVMPQNVFVYEKGKDELHSSFVAGSKSKSISSEPVWLSRSISSKSDPNTTSIWSDGYGNALLAMSQGKHNVYRFSSRFNPNWNDLPWSDNFVNMIYNLLFQNKNAFNTPDKRTIDRKQMMPVMKGQKDFDKQKFIQTTDLSKVFWVVAFLLFFLERYISLISKKEVYG